MDMLRGHANQLSSRVIHIVAESSTSLDILSTTTILLEFPDHARVWLYIETIVWLLSTLASVAPCSVLCASSLVTTSKTPTLTCGFTGSDFEFGHVVLL